ncbi:MAG: cation:proton antiporter [Nanoarchaeota archaeon]
MQDQLITVLSITFFALIAAIVASKFKQPVLLGFLLVGAIIGPHTLNFVRDVGIINLIIELGAALLLFMIGIEFNLNKLKSVGMKSVFIGIFKIGIIFFLAYHVFSLFLTTAEAAILAIIISFSSTIIIVKILEARNMMVRQEIPTLIAILIIEDIVAVSVLTILTGIGKAEGTLINTFTHLFNALFILILIYIVCLAILKPIFKNFILKNSNDSVTMFTALSMILLFSWLAHLLGFSFSLGAFLAGSLIASIMPPSESKHFHRAISPYSFLFSSLFFIAVGTLVNIGTILDYKLVILATIVVVILTRLIAVGLLTYLFSSFKSEQTFFSSIIMISVGEFSLLVARAGQGLTPGFDLVTITSVIIFVSAIVMTITLNHATAMQSRLSQTEFLSTKVKIFASYLKKVFDGLDLENTYTISFRKVLNVIGGFIIAFLVITNLIISFSGVLNIMGHHIILTLGYYAIGAILLAFVGWNIYNYSKKAHATLAIILANQSFTRNIHRSKRIIKAASAGFFLILIGLFLPFFLFLAKLPKAAGLISLVIVALGLFIIKKSIGHIDSSLKDNAYPKYEKYNSFTIKKYHTPQAAFEVKK